MKFRSFFFFILCLPLWSASGSWAKTVSLPISIDYPMLTSLVALSAFTETGRRARVVDEGGDCRQVTLSEPIFTEKGGQVRFSTRVAVHAGVVLGGRCLLPVEWEGYLVLNQRPSVDPLTWRLSFDIESSSLETLEHRPARVAGVVWGLIKTRVYAYLERMSVDLSLPFTELGRFVNSVLAGQALKQARKIIESLRPGEAVVERQSLVIPVLADLEEVSEPVPPEETPVALTELTASQVGNWEAWDEFLVSMMVTLARKPLSEDQRQVLFSVLLDMRYRFSQELMAPSSREDVVRRQFVDAWQQLSPIFRAHLTAAGSAGTLLGYLAFFSASDALAALDEAGPGIGIEVSRDGLLRLIQFLSEGPYIALDYRTDVNPELRRVLDLDDESPEGDLGTEVGPSAPGGRLIQAGGRLIDWLGRHFSARAWAGDSHPPPDTQSLEAWVSSLAGADNYRVRVLSLLSDVTERVLKKTPLNVYFHEPCRKLIPAVAWQESCMRQFTKDNGRVIYLRSYNGSSVGIMQINERVWRGVYDLERLRWKIGYNAQAGAEILTLYLHRFLLPKAAASDPDMILDGDLLAQVLYAMYNGGPAEFGRFQKRHQTGRLFLSDRLFFEKYEWVESGKWQRLRQCFGG